MLASLLPHHWFVNQSMVLLLVIAAVAMVGVIKGADWLVESAAAIAGRLGMPKVVIGATIVSLGTTCPEAAVSVLAAWSGQSGLALGNGVGSIIADTGLIFGVGCLMIALPADRFVLSRQGWVQFGSAVLLAVICYGLYALYGNSATIGLGIGALFLVLLVLYLQQSVKWSRQHPTVDDDSHVGDKRPLGTLIGMGIAGLAVVVITGDALVGSVSEVATRWGIPKTVIAATLVAFGTSLPELVVGITSIRKGHPELLVGNVIGADILNVLFVIGASAVGGALAGQPLEIVETLPNGSHSYVFLTVQLPAMLVMLTAFRLYIAKAVRTGHFARWMGGPLVAMYLVYVVVQYVVS